MRGQVVARTARHHRNVRLWFGLLVERDRGAGTDVPTRPEGMLEGFSCQHDGGGMGWTLPLLDDNLATHELKALVRMKDAKLVESIVFGSRPVPSTDG